MGNRSINFNLFTIVAIPVTVFVSGVWMMISSIYTDGKFPNPYISLLALLMGLALLATLVAIIRESKKVSRQTD